MTNIHHEVAKPRSRFRLIGRLWFTGTTILIDTNKETMSIAVGPQPHTPLRVFVPSCLIFFGCGSAAVGQQKNRPLLNPMKGR
ncbi:MAG: hypothetical protein ACHRHE_18590 [Tepidisphaerales bacterium]